MCCCRRATEPTSWAVLPQIGVSQHLSTVSSYMVDLKRVKKSGGAALHSVAHGNQPDAEPGDPKGSALRRSYERPAAGCSSQR